MICEKCGNNNPADAKICKHCKSEMPGTTSCGGFADILSYKEEIAQNNFTSEGVSEQDMQRLFKKTDKIAKSTQAGTLFGMIAMSVSCLVLVVTIIFGVATLKSVNSLKDEISGGTKQEIPAKEKPQEKPAEKPQEKPAEKPQETTTYEKLIEKLEDALDDVEDALEDVKDDAKKDSLTKWQSATKELKDSLEAKTKTNSATQGEIDDVDKKIKELKEIIN